MKRYYDYCDGDMRESDDGEWVRFEDAKAEVLEKTNDLHATIDKMVDNHNRLMDSFMALQAEKLRMLEFHDRRWNEKHAEVEALKGELAKKELALAQLQKEHAELKEGPPQYEQCSRCAGTGLSTNMQGEIDECHECGGNSVMRVAP